MHLWAPGPGHFTTQALFYIIAAPVLRVAQKISFLLHHQNTAQLGMPPALQGACRPFSLCTTIYSSIAGCRAGLATAQLARHNHHTITAGPCFPIWLFKFLVQQVFNLSSSPYSLPILSDPKLEL